VLSGGNTAATMRAAAQQTSGVNAAMTYGTDGGLQALDLVVMDDTLGVQPVYQPAPVVRAPVLEAHPEIRSIGSQGPPGAVFRPLNGLFGAAGLLGDARVHVDGDDGIREGLDGRLRRIQFDRVRAPDDDVHGRPFGPRGLSVSAGFQSRKRIVIIPKRARRFTKRKPKR